MGAVTNMRPELFRMVITHVPFVDVLNTMLDASLPLTVGEYEEWGNPQIAEDYFYMKSYCPYTNLERKDYPAILAKTGLNDSQVMYWEPAKYVAKMRTLKTGANPLLLKINMGAGHGGASGRYDYLRKIAICDQMEQPGPGKKLVRREVVRVITPGTATDVALLDARENNFLASVAKHTSGSPVGLAFVDLSTGEFQATEFSGARADDDLRDELQLLRPRETLLPRPQQLFETAKTSLLEGVGGVESRLEDWVFQRDYAERILREQFGVAELTGFGLDDHPQALVAAGAIVHYLRENAAREDRSAPANENVDASGVEALRHLDRVRYYEQHDALVLDPVSVRNLELLTPIFTEDAGRTSGPATLIAALDATVTGMGARLLRSCLLRPLIEGESIEGRLNAVTHLVQQTVLRGEIRKELKGILDLERLTSRITLGLATPRELVALRKSLAQLPVLKKFLTPPPAGGSELLRQLHQEIDELSDVRERLERAIADEPPALATDPGMIRSGYHAELDELRELSQHSKQIIAAMEERERKRTNIGSLKIRFK